MTHDDPRSLTAPPFAPGGFFAVLFGFLLVFLLASGGSGCQHGATVTPPPPVARPLVGAVEKLDAALDTLVDPAARVEVLSQGYKWSEGPVWTGGALLFSDVPNDVVWRWTDAAGATEFLRPSGYTGTTPRGASRARTAWPSTRRPGSTSASTATVGLRASIPTPGRS